MVASEYQPLLDNLRTSALAKGFSPGGGGVRGAGVNPLAAALASLEGFPRIGQGPGGFTARPIVPGPFKPSPEGTPAEYQQGHPIGLPPTPAPRS